MEDEATKLESTTCNPRDGWAEGSRALSIAGDDELIWPEFPNDDDAKLIW